jgi:hypothetical protein
MEQDRFLSELTGKVVWVATSGGIGSKNASPGNYRGTLAGFDGQFVKLEYEISKFEAGTTEKSTGVILINADYIISVEEYRESLNV